MYNYIVPYPTTTTMKFVLALVALTLVAAVNGKPTTVFMDNGMANVEANQVSAVKIGYAEKDLQVAENQLKAFSDAESTITAATSALTTAMDTDGYADESQYVHASEI